MSAQTQTLILLIANYFKTQPVLKAWLFGSYARGEEKPWSDMDILVQYDRKQENSQSVCSKSQVCNSTLKICWDVKLTLLKTERFVRGLLKV